MMTTDSLPRPMITVPDLSLNLELVCRTGREPTVCCATSLQKIFTAIVAPFADRVATRSSHWQATEFWKRVKWISKLGSCPA